VALTKLEPAPLAYPNGGGIAAMASKKPESHRLEVEALAKKHEAEMAKLKEKHAKINAPMGAKKNG
jgi:hypothetical protein